MRGNPGREERLAGLFVVIGSTLVFAPVVWLLQRWSEAVERDPAGAWGGPWLVGHLSAHPYLIGGAILLGFVLSSGLAMLMVVYAAKRLAARLVGRGPGDREKGSGA
jgi:hypothetical protein